EVSSALREEALQVASVRSVDESQRLLDPPKRRDAMTGRRDAALEGGDQERLVADDARPLGEPWERLEPRVEIAVAQPLIRRQRRERELESREVVGQDLAALGEAARAAFVELEVGEQPF